MKLAPISSMEVERQHFDTEKMQRRTTGFKSLSHKYNKRKFLLNLFNNRCVYCKIKGNNLEIDHIIPKSLGGSDRISNLIIACNECNRKKGNQPIENFLKTKQNQLATILEYIKPEMRNTSIISTTYKTTLESLKLFGIPVKCFNSKNTKKNRIAQGYDKGHWVDASCVGNIGNKVYIPKTLKPLHIKATGRGRRQFCNNNKYGFPNGTPKKNKSVKGFREVKSMA